MKRAVLAFLAVVPIGLLWAAPAGADDPRVPVPVGDQLFPSVAKAGGDGFCENDDVLMTITKNKEYFIHQTTDEAGATTFRITGSLKVTVTNVRTGESVPYNISGPGTIVVYPDQSFSLDVQGHNLLWTPKKNLRDFPDVPTLNYAQGHVTVEVDASGNTTYYNLEGRSTDVCDVLGAS